MPRRRIASSGGLVALVVLQWAALVPGVEAQYATWIAENPTWTAPQEPFAIADDLYHVGSAGLASFLFTSEEGHVLIDAPLQENVPRILDNIRALGFDPADVRVLLASHAHFDHVGGLADMVEATGAELVLSRADAAFVEQGADAGLQTEGYPPVPAARTIGHFETVSVGDVTLTAHITAGHTPGCTTWSGEVRIGGAPFSFVSVCSLTVLPMYRIVGPGSTFPDHAESLCRSVEHLRTLRADVFLGPHGDWFGMAEKLEALRAGDGRAFVDPDGLGAYVEAAAARIDAVLAEQGRAGGCAASPPGA